MRRLLILAITLALALSFTAQAGDYYVKHKGDKRRAETTDDAALIYVFRPAAVGAAIKTWAFADDHFLGVSRSKGYYFSSIPPGKYTFWAKAENTSGVEVEVQAGEVYYFKTAIRLGFGKARVEMMQIDAAEAEKCFGKTSYCEPTEEGRQRAMEIAANRMDRAENSAEKKKEKAKKKAEK